MHQPGRQVLARLYLQPVRRGRQLGWLLRCRPIGLQTMRIHRRQRRQSHPSIENYETSFDSFIIVAYSSGAAVWIVPISRSPSFLTPSLNAMVMLF